VNWLSVRLSLAPWPQAKWPLPWAHLPVPRLSLECHSLTLLQLALPLSLRRALFQPEQLLLALPKQPVPMCWPEASRS